MLLVADENGREDEPGPEPTGQFICAKQMMYRAVPRLASASFAPLPTPYSLQTIYPRGPGFVVVEPHKLPDYQREEAKRFTPSKRPIGSWSLDLWTHAGWAHGDIERPVRASGWGRIDNQKSHESGRWQSQTT
ncbi:hypothetical protein G7Z17_g10854 [Cylindrodendrum hubeiense]|uniref:Uncharacterized protein n=1 Tax=Cylindrodendrum hubeiense TaxID=595255 RepID=A0A9P5LAU2_9HYPO|nr:hypothetical protein G7Z17_g10854 [Cylindrodendrum hubeiense]